MEQNTQILINYTPNDDGFTLSVITGDKSLFDYKDNEHEAKQTTLQIIEGLQRLISENINQLGYGN